MITGIITKYLNMHLVSVYNRIRIELRNKVRMTGFEPAQALSQ